MNHLAKDNKDKDALWELLSLIAKLKLELDSIEVQKELEQINKIIKKSIENGKFNLDDQFQIIELLAKVQNKYETHKRNKQGKKDIINSGVKAVAAATAARTLIGAGPLGMLAAGALGIASHFLFKSEDK